MAVVLRLTRMGHTKSPVYRIVAKERLSARDGKFLEIVGTYNPLTNPPAATLKEDRVRRWIDAGAVPSSVVRNVIRKMIPGYIEGREKHQADKVLARRQKRKQNAKGATKSAPKAKAATKAKAKK